MSTIGLCLAQKVAGGQLSKEQAEKAKRLIDSLEREYARTMGQTAAEAAAAARAAEIMAAEARAKKRDLFLQAQAADRTTTQALAHRKGAYAGVAGVFARDWWNQAGGTSVEARIKTVRRDLFRRFGAGIEAYHSKGLGLLRAAPESLVSVVRELYGEGSGDATAAKVAKAWQETADAAVERYNAAGGRLAAKKDWRLPQAMEPSQLKGRRAEWIDYMSEAFADGRLKVWDHELDRMVDDATFQKILDEAYDNIASDGLAKLTPGQVGGAKLANRRLDHRVFEWTSAPAWLDANRRWGRGDRGIYPMLLSHIEGMARDIGLLEKLGPNPDLTARMLIDHAKKAGTAPLKLANLEAIYDHVSGRASVPVSATLARTMGGIRAWLSSAQLGSALLSSTTDFQTMRLTAKLNGMPPARVIARYAKLIAGDADSKAIGARTGIIAETLMQNTHAALRDQLDEQFSGVAGMAAEAVFRASLLARHTDSARQAFGQEFLGFLADHARTRFADLPAGLQRAFARYGIDAEMWKTIGQGVERERGVAFVSPAALDRIDREAGARLMDMVLTETDYAVVMPGARERALMLGKSRRGSVLGEILRSGWQYKSFPVTMVTTHLLRGLQEAREGRYGYVFSLALGTGILGALGLQMKQLAQGKDPRNMTDPKFWGASFIQGGGAGILGDFLYATADRSDRSFYEQMLGGPAAGLIDDTVKLIGGNISGLAQDEKTNFGRELARFIRNYTPGSTLWYARLAADRLLWNNLQRMLDRDASTSFRRMEQRARRDYGQAFWWRPGTNSPQRAPDFAGSLQ